MGFFIFTDEIKYLKKAFFIVKDREAQGVIVTPSNQVLTPYLVDYRIFVTDGVPSTSLGLYHLYFGVAPEIVEG